MASHFGKRPSSIVATNSSVYGLIRDMVTAKWFATKTETSTTTMPHAP